jgi:lipopolysaccharide export system protein LptA
MNADDSGPIKIESGMLRYSENSNKIVAEQNVRISSGGLTISGTELESALDAKCIVVSGSVSITENGANVYGDRIEYSFGASTGYVYNADGNYSEWRFRSEKVYKDKDAFYLVKPEFTTCELAKPHYHFAANSAKIIPQKGIGMKRAVMYVGSVPVFYYPKYSAQPEERRGVFEIFPGNNSYDGVFLKTKYGYPFTKNAYSKTYVDLFSLSGIGLGEEVNYTTPGKIDGTAYGYYIKDQKIQQERWTIMSSHRQQLNESWYIQGNANLSNARDFNQYYFGESWNRVNVLLRSNAAITRQKGGSTLRFSAERIDVSTVPGRDYYTESMVAPKIEFTQITSKAGKLPFYYTVNANLFREETYLRAFPIWRAQTDVSVSKDFGFPGRMTTLTPKFGLIENWQDRDENLPNANGYFLTRYYTNTNLRQKFTSFSFVDFIYNAQLRSKREALEQDYDSSDYGFDSHNVTANAFLSYSYSSYLRITDTYNLMNLRDAIIEERIRLSPLVVELKAPFGKRLDTYSRYSKQEIKPGKTGDPDSLKAFSTEATYEILPGRNIIFGVSYFDDMSSGQLKSNTQYKNSASFWLGKKTQIKYSTIFEHNGGQFNFRDNSIEIYRDLHCWEMSVSYKKRDFIEEFYINVGLKIQYAAKKKLYDTSHERRYYPWR